MSITAIDKLNERSFLLAVYQKLTAFIRLMLFFKLKFWSKAGVITQSVLKLVPNDPNGFVKPEI